MASSSDPFSRVIGSTRGAHAPGVKGRRAALLNGHRRSDSLASRPEGRAETILAENMTCSFCGQQGLTATHLENEHTRRNVNWFLALMALLGFVGILFISAGGIAVLAVAVFLVLRDSTKALGMRTLITCDNCGNVNGR